MGRESAGTEAYRRRRSFGVLVLGVALFFCGSAGAAPSARLVAHTPPGGGIWHGGSYPVAGARPLLVGVRWVNGSPAYVAWIDHTRTRLALYPGLQEPRTALPRGRGEVPSAQRWRLLATFNGGFRSAAGAGGFLVNGRVDAPLQKGFGTLVEYRDGSLAILDWQGRTSPGTLVLARQNLPPLVWAGRPTARTSENWLWGTTLGGGAAVWRTAVGVTKRGDLVYAAAAGQTASSLAALMVQIGAVRAIELDINAEWPSFIGYARRGGRDPVKLVPNPQQSAYRYLASDNRDFFAVYTRAGGGPFVPFR
jgi:Phosphodiester glycosidase